MLVFRGVVINPLCFTKGLSLSDVLLPRCCRTARDHPCGATTATTGGASYQRPGARMGRDAVDTGYTPGKLTWNPKMEVWKMIFLSIE